MDSNSNNEIVYLNHAGTSWPKPQPVLQAIVDATDSNPELWPDLFQRSIDTVASFFNVDSCRLLLTPGCTSALNLALMDQDWQPGDRIITSSFEHHALFRNLVKLRSHGIEVLHVTPGVNSLFNLEQLARFLREGRSKMVAITAACNVTGALLPYREVIELAHRYGAKVLIDGAQIAGWIDLDLMELDVDFFTFAGHKGPQAPWGIGGLYVAESSIMRCPTATCELRPGTTKEFDSIPGYCDAGSVDLVALAGLAAGCDWLSEPENENRLERARRLAAELTEKLRESSNAEIYHDFEFKLPTVAISAKEANTKIAAKLKQNGVVVSAGLQCAPQAHQSLKTSEHGVIRFSFGPTSTPKDLEKMAKIF